MGGRCHRLYLSVPGRYSAAAETVRIFSSGGRRLMAKAALMQHGGCHELVTSAQLVGALPPRLITAVCIDCK